MELENLHDNVTEIQDGGCMAHCASSFIKKKNQGHLYWTEMMALLRNCVTSGM